MPPIHPFPFPLSLGTDICHIPRIAKIITRDDHGASASRFIRRILTARERADVAPKLKRYVGACSCGGGGGDGNTHGHEGRRLGKSQAVRELSQWLAGRFAAKEATKKAYESRALSWKEICVRISAAGGRGKPYVVVKALTTTPTPTPLSQMEKADDDDEEDEDEDEDDAVDGGAGGELAQLSLSHDGDYAMAVVMVADRSLRGGGG